MPSPFPGMDPWLERPSYFPILHGNMIFVLQETLQAILPEPYDVASNERTWIERADRRTVSDVNVVAPRSRRTRPRRGENGTTVTVAEPEGGVLIRVPSMEVRETFLEIHIRKGGKLRLVTHIEVLSPTNKRASHKIHEQYLEKQEQCLNSEVNLVEIDLLRSGRHTTAIDESALRERIPEFDYHVCIHRFDKPSDFLVFPIRMEERLPDIPIPLLPEDGHVTIDLQSVFDRCYDVGPYRKRINYLRDKQDVPLTRAQSAWAKSVLRPHKRG